jgi:hypothetical protein
MEGTAINESIVAPTDHISGLLFNVTGGYLEGIVRGYRNSLLTGQNYSNASTPLHSFDNH